MTARNALALREAGKPRLTTVAWRRETNHSVSHVPASARPDLVNPNKGFG
jgi:hypothetical protein